MSSVPAEATGKRNIIVQTIVKYPILPTFAFFIIMCAAFVLLSPVSRSGINIFLSPTNIANIFEATAAFSIGAFAMTLVLLVGCIDLSTESIIALCCVIFGISFAWWDLGFTLSLLLTLTTGAVCGVINAVIVIKFKVIPFLATIAVAFVFNGLAYTISQSRSILLKSTDLVRYFGSVGSGASFLGLPALLCWTLLFLIAMYLLISKSKFGRWAQATGGNAQAAYSSGVNINMVQAVSFILMGIFCAFIALTFCARLGNASPSYGAGYGLKFIIAAVLGGTSFTGDGGNVWGTLLGSLVMGVLTNGLGIIGVNIYIQQVITGIVIVAAVVFSVYLSNKK